MTPPISANSTSVGKVLSTVKGKVVAFFSRWKVEKQPSDSTTKSVFPQSTQPPLTPNITVEKPVAESQKEIEDLNTEISKKMEKIQTLSGKPDIEKAVILNAVGEKLPGIEGEIAALKKQAGSDAFLTSQLATLSQNFDTLTQAYEKGIKS